MSNARAHSQQALVSGLLRALRPALAPGAEPSVRSAARDVAQVLLLAGLDAALAESLRHEGPQPPREAGHVIARILRIAEAAEQEGSLAPFVEADAQLAALAETLAGLEWTEGSAETAAAAAVSAAEALAEVVPSAKRLLERSRLEPVVAGALRASLDWLLAPGETPELIVQDTAISLVLPSVRADGLALAGATLSAAHGSLIQRDDELWQVRVPLLVERPSFLLVRQGHLSLALPWHAVARLRMLNAEARAALREPVLSPLAAGADLRGERPSALLAHGLTRAWFVAERLVWRIVAQPSEPDRASPVPGLEQIVEVEEGERYWVAEPQWLLRRVAPAETPPSAWRPRGHELPDLSADGALSAPAFEPLEQASLSAPVPVAPEPPPLLTAEHAMPLRTPPAPLAEEALPHVPEALDPAPTSPPPAAPPVAPPAAKPAAKPVAKSAAPVAEPERQAWHEAPRALVVDDSLVARLFLGRLLERRGFQVEQAADAAEALQLIELGPWAVVFADLALPDLAPREWFERLLAIQLASDPPFTVIALTRDRDDELAAEEAGVPLRMAKPFESEALDDLLQHVHRREEG